jgi:hypothetical protein
MSSDACRRRLAPAASLLLALALALPGAAAAATRHALLVGVNDYPGLDQALSLRGPENDAQFMADQLLGLGFEEARVTLLLSTAEDEARRPTRSVILAELARLADAVGPDDIVYLHFAGHGSQQPDSEGDDDGELDGLDEIFLPMDVGEWDGASGTVENAITDDEIAESISALRSAGAFVWAVFDACHSGTMTRSAATEDGIRYRNVRPDQLGIPDASVDEALASAPRTRGGRVDDRTLDLDASAEGGFVAFYAVQSHELAPEERLPRGVVGRVSRGVFSFTLAQALASAPDVTYRQAAAQIIQRYRAERRPETPIFEGDLDRRVFGGLEASPRQWPIRSEAGALVVDGGALEGIGEGSVVAILESPTDELDAVLGYATLTDVTSALSRVAPTDWADLDADPSVLKAGRYARMVDPSFTLLLEVALEADEAPEHAVGVEAVARLREREDEDLYVIWGDEPADADVRLLLDDGRIWFLSPGACIPGRLTPGTTDDLCTATATPPPSIGLAGKNAEEVEDILAEWLRRAARAAQLLSIPTEVATTDTTRSLGVRLSVCEVGRTARQIAMQRGCIAGAEPAREYAAADVPELRDGDHMTVHVANEGGAPVDLTVLFVGSSFGIDAMFPVGGELNRIAPGEEIEFALTVNAETLGQEQLVFIAVPGVDVTRNFAFLAQDGIATRGGGAGGSGTRASDMLRRAGTRGVSRETSQSLGATVLGWRTVP